jgi:hypothetical protein
LIKIFFLSIFHRQEVIPPKPTNFWQSLCKVSISRNHYYHHFLRHNKALSTPIIHFTILMAKIQQPFSSLKDCRSSTTDVVVVIIVVVVVVVAIVWCSYLSFVAIQPPARANREWRAKEQQNQKPICSVTLYANFLIKKLTIKTKIDEVMQ